jgi:GTPase SAR1 family protein
MFKIVFLGDPMTGKTAFLNKQFISYSPTLNANIIAVKYETNYGPVEFTCWDLGGHDHLCENRSRYYVCADACFIFYNGLIQNTFENVQKWERDVKKMCGYLPVFIIGTNGSPPGETNGLTGLTGLKNHFQFSEGRSEIFLKLAQLLMGQPDLKLI